MLKKIIKCFTSKNSLLYLLWVRGNPTPLFTSLIKNKKLPTRYKVLISKFIFEPITKFRIKKVNELKDGITVVITSAGRKEYLVPTLESMRKHLKYDGKIYWYIIDDLPDSKETREFIKNSNFDLTILNSKNKGLGYSLNKIYSEIKTKYVFHCEDDWLFMRDVPLNKTINLFEKNKLSQLILNKKSFNERRIDPENKQIINGKKFAIYNGFSFNPHLTTINIFRKFMPFSYAYTEEVWSMKYRQNKLISGIYFEDNNLFIKHLGVKKKAVRY